MSETITKNTVIDRIRAAALPSSKANLENYLKIIGRLSKNYKPLYNDLNEEKDVILHHLHNRFLKTKSKEDVVNNQGKNLLYFSIFMDDSYLELLSMCLKSIIINTPNINFDVLFITDTATKSKIEKLEVISNFNVDYLICDGVNSAPLASLKKLNIFDYQRISEYSKILFFDVDIICIKDLNIIFQQPIEQEKLYVSTTPVHKSPLLLSPTNGIMYLSRDDATFLYNNPDIVPFNAGQFMFLNSSRMKEHFENVRWLHKAWPSQFFYEQSFMNYYFVFKSLTKPLTISSKDLLTPVDVQLISVAHAPDSLKLEKNIEYQIFVQVQQMLNGGGVMTVSGASNSNFSNESRKKYTEMPEGVLSEPTPMHNTETVAIHFAATPPTGVDKKKFIINYANAYKLHI